MHPKSLGQDEQVAIQIGLTTLYAHGWSPEYRTTQCADILAHRTFDEGPVTPENQERFAQHRASLERHVSYDWSEGNAVYFLYENTTPNLQAGSFEINGEEVDPSDGLSLELLERAVRFHYGLTGDLAEMNYTTKDILSLENARAFVNDWRQSQSGEPVMIRGVGDRLKLYFSPSEPGQLPSLDVATTAKSLIVEYPEMSEDQAIAHLADLQETMNGPERGFNAYQRILKDWQAFFPPESHSEPSGPSL